MSSSVSYISHGYDIREKTAKAVDKSLSFELGEQSKFNLGTGTDPKVGKDIDVNYAISEENLVTSMTRSGQKKQKNPKLSEIVDAMNDTLFIPKSGTTLNEDFKTMTTKYNRFKVANPNLALQKGFAHVFFVRPSCNLLSGASYSLNLRDELQANEHFHYTWKNSPNVVKELVAENGSGHDFMLTLSNAVASFSLSEEYINSDMYGKTYTGYKIAYGQHNIESKTAGEFQVTFNDDRNLNIYQLHRVWVEYISGVFRGEISPITNNIVNKIMDYVGSCYYILTAEDGETIIFWSKYYGIFPTNIPSSQYSWGSGNVISNPQVDITYKYSFKEDFNPYSILEFNYNSRMGQHDANYIPIYDTKLDHVGATWVGAPFIELIRDPSSGVYEYKLRFRPS